MKLGYVGLGKMGYNMTLRLLEKDHTPVVYDRKEGPVEELGQKGAVEAYSLEEMISKLKPPRTVWIMVPHKVASQVIEEVSKYLEAGDVVIDGGNSFYKDTLENHEKLSEKGIDMLDVGVSGGPSGAMNGASMMVGGKPKVYEKYEQLFNDLTVEAGFGYVGNPGAGHFVKMVHNGIEYGMMQAIAEGFDIMAQSDFEVPLTKVAEIYNHGAVVESNLMGFMKSAFEEFGEDLKEVSGKAGESGEGRWTVQRAHEENIPDRVIHSALEARETSRMAPGFQGKIINALRNQFGGHSAEDPDVNV